MRQANPFHFDSSARATARREFAAAFAVVIALHAALAVWLLRAHERPAPPPEPPRTIVARLLSAAPAAPTAPTASPAAVPHSGPARPAEPARTRPTGAPRTHSKPSKPPPPAHRETPSPVPPAPSAAITPPAPPSAGSAVRDNPAPPAAAAPAAPQPSLANAAPKEVSRVDCNIAQPDYPEAARRRGEKGTAVVRFIVGVDGRVESARIQQSSGYARLDEAALDALRGSACRPWKEAGVPIRVAYAQPFVFGLGN